MDDELELRATLRRGASGPAVRRVQEWLTLHGLAVQPDGLFGPATHAAVRRFQRARRLTDDGIVTPQLFTLLVAPMHNAIAPISRDGWSMADLTVAYARQHLAQSPREIGGDNRGPWVRLYMLGHEGATYRWCAGFVFFCLQQAATTRGERLPIRFTFSCDVLAESAKLRGLFDGSKRLYIHTNQAKGIIAGVYFARRFGITPIVVGGDESWLVTDVLKQFDVPVVLTQTHRLPSLPHDDIDMPFKLPALLKKAGVRFCISGSGNWNQRNLPFEAGTAAAYGLTREEALAAITSDAAAILGIDSTAGSIEVGKDATLFISTGDALDMRTNNVETAFILGRNIDLNNKQKELYRKYRTKYGQKP